jgi:hypothetical protein
VCAWIGADDWDTPIPYDYGVDNGYVYNGDSQVAPVADYAQQANQIATSAAQPSDEEEWMPLGMFGIAPPGQDEIKVTLQLAITKSGAVGGTYMNSDGHVVLDITGAVDKKTQRVAWKVGDGKDAVTMVTGMSDLNQDKGTILLFFSDGASESWTMTRMDQDTAKKMQSVVSGNTETRQKLVAAWQELEPNLDDRWKDYLAMPDSALSTTQPPDVQELREAQTRFKLVKASPQLKEITDDPNFQKTYDLLGQYLSEME